MITAKISAGSSSIVQDIIDMCVAIHPIIGDWQGFFYKSTTGDQSWCVWVQRMDEDAREFQYVSSSGKASPPDAYELITVSCPTVTGFSLSFTQVNAMPSVFQSGPGSGSGGGASSSLPIYNIRMSAAGSSAFTDYFSMVNNTVGSAGGFTHRYFYISTHGSQPWACYAWFANFGSSGINPCIITVTMGGLASPPAGSEALAIAAPSVTLCTTNSFTQVSGPLSISFQP